MVTPTLQEFDANTPISAIGEALDRDGAAIVHDLFSKDDLGRLNKLIDPLVDQFVFKPRGNEIYDEFAGRQTVRLQNMVANCPDMEAIIAHPDILNGIDHMLKDKCTSFILSTAELIEIGPEETAQSLHRDQGVWTEVDKTGEAILASAIVALSPFTKDNGATQVAPGSHKWDPRRQAEPDEIIQAEMPAGSALLFRGDLLHGGGENRTQDRRRCLASSYLVGWLRPFENAQLSTPLETVKKLSPAMQGLLGYDLYRGAAVGFTDFGYVNYRNPKHLLD